MQSGLIYLRAWRAGKEEKFSHAGAGPIKIRSAFVEERFTALMAGAETAGYTGGNFLFLRATRGNAMDAIYCVPLTVATFFNPLPAATAIPVARHRPTPYTRFSPIRFPVSGTGNAVT